MKFADFSRLYLEARKSKDREQFLKDLSWQDWMEPYYYANRLDDLDLLLSNVHRCACDEMQTLLSITDLDENEFASRYMLSEKTVEDWKSGKRPPDKVCIYVAFAAFTDCGAIGSYLTAKRKKSDDESVFHERFHNPFGE